MKLVCVSHQGIVGRPTDETIAKLGIGFEIVAVVREGLAQARNGEDLLSVVAFVALG